MIWLYVLLIWCIIQLLFIFLKLTGICDMDWEFVYLPIWLPVTLLFFGAIICFFCYIAFILFINILLIII